MLIKFNIQLKITRRFFNLSMTARTIILYLPRLMSYGPAQNLILTYAKHLKFYIPLMTSIRFYCQHTYLTYNISFY